ncbi:uncharacterized protein EV154DRAFT_162074 [Mucor mucedo]|uniref:uncharacterized protein n=1 Tax=Mucor mucedo TaxID=29922 RepID=UPI00221FFCF4|nr:uncharacterized protein EV154DRAFT_162074 [Mucor mucedo]KAI7865392.1 hypothetical protein EV154DRAFT_162074 [Mucor mucedo]
MIMYSAEEDENIVVVAPVLWIEADTPCHSELCGLLSPTCLYPCRKCYILLRKGIASQKGVDYFVLPHAERNRGHYVVASSDCRRLSIIQNAPTTGTSLSAKDLCYKDRKKDRPLELQSYDRSKDTTVEVLHAILLGISKYMIVDLVKTVLKNRSAILDRLSNKLKQYQEECVGLSRKFTRQLRHCGSFLGRDFKILIQILPIVLLSDFSNEEILKNITVLFVHLGKLCSLLFEREMKSNFNEYIATVGRAIKEFISALHYYDLNNDIPGHNAYTGKVKIHLLTHIPQEIRRFGTLLQYETEKGEQFNKHIREHITFTNKLNPSRDIGIKFGKQSMMRHVLEGGSWLNENKIREKARDDVISFIQSIEDRVYLDLLGGSRDFIDNTDPSYKKIGEGSFALFRHTNNDNSSLQVNQQKPFVGVVCGPSVLSGECSCNNFERGCIPLNFSQDQVLVPLNQLEVETVLNVYSRSDGT